MFTQVADKMIKPANDRRIVLHKDGNTLDIINAILYADKHSNGDTKEFAKTFKSFSLDDTCRKIWNFVKTNVHYKEDGWDRQDIKSPSQVWKSRIADCKSMSVFIASILHNLHIPYKYRFVSYRHNKIPTHVYIVVPIGTHSNYIIDAVYHSYNKEKPYISKLDIKKIKN